MADSKALASLRLACQAIPSPHKGHYSTLLSLCAPCPGARSVGVVPWPARASAATPTRLCAVQGLPLLTWRGSTHPTDFWGGLCVFVCSRPVRPCAGQRRDRRRRLHRHRRHLPGIYNAFATTTLPTPPAATASGPPPRSSCSCTLLTFPQPRSRWVCCDVPSSSCNTRASLVQFPPNKK